MPAFIDITGQTFFHLTAIERVENAPSGNTQWLCQCVCGNTKIAQTSHLRAGEVKSCGCRAWENHPNGNVEVHGLSDTPEYAAWASMKDRCKNPSPCIKRLYGHVNVCDRWEKSFTAFLADMGPRPSPEHSLDRFPNRRGNYEPGNVRWATPMEQTINRDYTKMITFNGETMCIGHWADSLGISRKTLANRLGRLNWSVERALTEPVHNVGRNACR
jgi:hypothetical protein